jgi:hypothetical protein
MIYDVNYSYVPLDGSGPVKVAMTTIEADSYSEAAGHVEATTRDVTVMRLELDIRREQAHGS